MRILILTRKFPYQVAPDGEDLRVIHFCRLLSQRHELFLLTYGPPPAPSPLRSYFRHVSTVGLEPQKHLSAHRTARWLQAFSPRQLYPLDARVSQQLREVVVSSSIDLIWIPSWSMMPYLDIMSNVPVVLDVMDDGVLEYLRELRHNASLTELAIKIKRLFVTYFFERIYFPRARICCLVS